MSHKILSPVAALRIISVKTAPPQIIYKQEDKRGNARVTLYAPESPRKQATRSHGLFLSTTIFALLFLGTLGGSWFFLPPLIKFQVSTTLEQFANQFKTQALLEAFRAPEKEVRLQAAQKLGSLRTTTQPLLDTFEFALQDEDEEVRNQVASAFGQLDPERNSLVPQIVLSSTPKETNTNKNTTNILPEAIKQPEIIREEPKEILPVLKEEKPKVIEEKPKVIEEKPKEISRKTVESSKVVPQKIKTPQIVSLTPKNQFSSREIQAQIQLLKHSDADTRMRARFALSEMGESTLSYLSQAFQDESYEFRREIGLVLGKMGEMAVPILIEALQHENWSNRYIAADTLTDLGPKAHQATSFLAQTVQDKNKNVQEASIKALGEIGTKAQAAIPALSKTLEENSTHLRILAAEALLKIGVHQPQAKQILVEIQKNHENEKLREQAKMVLQNTP